MLELQCIQFAGWILTEGQHRVKASKKKKTREAGLFFSGSHFVLDASSGSGLTQLSPNRKSLSIVLHILCSKRYVDRRQSSCEWDVRRGARAIQLGGGALKAQRAEGAVPAEGP